MMHVVLTAFLAVSLPAGGTATNIAGTAAAMESGGAFAFDFTALASGALRSIDGSAYLFLRDSSGGIFAMARKNTPGIEAGDVVRVRGSRRANDGRYNLNPLHAASVAKLGHTAPPEPVFAPIREILDRKHDFAPVRTEGLVRDVALSETSRIWTSLSLFDEGELLRVSVPLDATHIPELSELIGRRVEVTGFPNPTSGSPRLFAGITLHCAGLSAIRAVDSGGTDPFDTPDIGTILLKTPAQIAASGRVRATGRVACVWGGNQALVRTACGDHVRIVCEDCAPPPAGVGVECTGFPRTDAFHITLVRAKWRDAPTVPPVPDEKCIPVSVAEILNGRRVKHELHGRRVKMPGRLRSVRTEDDGSAVATAEDGNILFKIVCAGGAPADAVPGCTVEASGTCVMEAKYWKPETVVPQIRDVMLVAAAPGDIRITGRPPWWTPGRLSALACSLAAALFAVFVWNRSLTRLAERRGRRLYAEEIGRVKAELKAEERTRLAEELHDSLSQNLAGASMELQTAERCNDPAETKRQVASAGALIKSCLGDLRNALWDLRSRALDAPDLETAIRRTLLPHVKGVSLAVRLDVPRRRLSEQELHDVLRVVRELALNGILRGGARAVEVSGKLEDSVLSITVKDDGCGFDPAAAPGAEDGHFGMQGVRDRLARRGGALDIDSAPGRGTAARFSLRLGQV